ARLAALDKRRDLPLERLALFYLDRLAHDFSPREFAHYCRVFRPEQFFEKRAFILAAFGQSKDVSFLRLVIQRQIRALLEHADFRAAVRIRREAVGLDEARMREP